jgi:hypothetical protein
MREKDNPESLQASLSALAICTKPLARRAYALVAFG